MIYERRLIRVKIIGKPGLRTNKEASVKPIFRSYKLGQSILSLVFAEFFVLVFFYRVYNIKFQVSFPPKW